jgi:hypothetical protein
MTNVSRNSKTDLPNMKHSINHSSIYRGHSLHGVLRPDCTTENISATVALRYSEREAWHFFLFNLFYHQLESTIL